MKKCGIALILAMAAGAAGHSFADESSECAGPFVTEKYPYPHMVILDVRNRCLMQWTVTVESPLALRCNFTSPKEKPRIRPDLMFRLTRSQYDAYLESLETTVAVNTSASLGDRWFFSGFSQDLTPDEAEPGCSPRQR